MSRVDGASAAGLRGKDFIHGGWTWLCGTERAVPRDVSLGLPQVDVTVLKQVQLCSGVWSGFSTRFPPDHFSVPFLSHTSARRFYREPPGRNHRLKSRLSCTEPWGRTSYASFTRGHSAERSEVQNCTEEEDDAEDGVEVPGGLDGRLTSSEERTLKPGLYLVGTPIGNLEDITLRALRVLRQANLILAEDTRHSAKLLRHYSIATPMMSYHQFNTSARAGAVLERLHRGDVIALVSDAGMPAISDPGAELVNLCVREQVPVVPVPGPAAVVTAFAACGFVTSKEFTFMGFPPEKPSQRAKRLAVAAESDAVQILYAAPHKLLAVLKSCLEAFGPNRHCVVGRELTKMHEELWRGTLSQALMEFEKRTAKGEITIVIEGKPSARGEIVDVEEESIESRLTELFESKLSLSEAVKEVVCEFGVRKNDVYSIALKVKEKLRQVT